MQSEVYRTLKLIAAALAMQSTISTPLAANADSSSDSFSKTCTASANHAALETGIPVNILLAISLTETGRNRDGRFEAWPWTVNMEGEGSWFGSRQAAYEYVMQKHDSGARSFDIGCFQINFKWHGSAFASIRQMFDPNANAIYAAQYLLDLYAEKGNWASAAAAYHSRTPKYADKYKIRFSKIYANLIGVNDAIKKAPARTASHAKDDNGQARANLYPLLQELKPERSSGSLVSLIGRSETEGIIRRSKGPLF